MSHTRHVSPKDFVDQCRVALEVLGGAGLMETGVRRGGIPDLQGCRTGTFPAEKVRM